MLFFPQCGLLSASICLLISFSVHQSSDVNGSCSFGAELTCVIVGSEHRALALHAHGAHGPAAPLQRGQGEMN